MGTREVFDYSVCAICASAYIVRFPDDIGKYYEGYYSFRTEKPTRRQIVLSTIYAWAVVRSGFASLFRPLFRCPRPWPMKYLIPNLQAFLFVGARSNARILDVGSGSGEFVRMMRRFGYSHATGIDPFLDEKSESDLVRRGDISSAPGTYDLILFNHTLEHMPDPEAALRKAAEIINSQGMILVQVPNMAARDFPLFQQDWCWLQAPYHYAIPSRKGLEVMAERCGLAIVDTICTSRADHYLYSDEYRRDIGDSDPRSVRRQLENGSFDPKRLAELQRLAYSLNKAGTGDWIAYYLVPAGNVDRRRDSAPGHSNVKELK